MKDPIIEEIREHRDIHAKKFNYNLDDICADLVERHKNSGHKLVRLKTRTLQAEKSATESARYT